MLSRIQQEKNYFRQLMVYRGLQLVYFDILLVYCWSIAASVTQRPHRFTVFFPVLGWFIENKIMKNLQCLYYQSISI